MYIVRPARKYCTQMEAPPLQVKGFQKNESLPGRGLYLTTPAVTQALGFTVSIDESSNLVALYDRQGVLRVDLFVFRST